MLLLGGVWGSTLGILNGKGAVPVELSTTLKGARMVEMLLLRVLWRQKLFLGTQRHLLACFYPRLAAAPQARLEDAGPEF